MRPHVIAFFVPSLIAAACAAPVRDLACTASRVRGSSVACTFTAPATDRYELVLSSGARVDVRCNAGALCFVEGGSLDETGPARALLRDSHAQVAETVVVVDGSTRALDRAQSRRAYPGGHILEVVAAGYVFGDDVLDFAVRVKDAHGERVEIFDGRGANLDAVLATPSRTQSELPRDARGTIGDVTGDGLPETVLIEHAPDGDVLVVSH